MTATFASKLTTPEPHYIPGYGGFCPQYKYHMGKSYGKLTSQLLTNPDISHSQRLVLQSLRYPVTDEEKEAEDSGVALKNRRRNWRENLFTNSMIPGYTGFIPRSQHHFAKTYAQITQDAVNDFMNQQSKMASQGQELAYLRALQPQQSTEEENKLLTAKYRTPFPPVTKEAGPFKPPNAFHEQGSPYFMEDNNPHKFFMSGQQQQQNPCLTAVVDKSKKAGEPWRVQENKASDPNGEREKKAEDPWGDGRRKAADRPGVQKENGCTSIQGQKEESCRSMKGFTGYVPRARFLFGSGYPVTTNRALVEFGQKMWKRNKPTNRAQGAWKEDQGLPNLGKIYPSDLGLLPQYTGYVPGYKFQYGKTYGHLTHNVLGLNTVPKEVAASM